MLVGLCGPGNTVSRVCAPWIVWAACHTSSPTPQRVACMCAQRTRSVYDANQLLRVQQRGQSPLFNFSWKKGLWASLVEPGLFPCAAHGPRIWAGLLTETTLAPPPPRTLGWCSVSLSFLAAQAGCFLSVFVFFTFHGAPPPCKKRTRSFTRGPGKNTRPSTRENY